MLFNNRTELFITVSFFRQRRRFTLIWETVGIKTEEILIIRQCSLKSPYYAKFNWHWLLTSKGYPNMLCMRSRKWSVYHLPQLLRPCLSKPELTGKSQVRPFMMPYVKVKNTHSESGWSLWLSQRKSSFLENCLQEPQKHRPEYRHAVDTDRQKHTVLSRVHNPEPSLDFVQNTLNTVF